VVEVAGIVSGSDASRVPRVAVLGCGYWGQNLVRVFDQLGALHAVHDPDPVAAAAMTEAHGVPSRAIEEILADDAIDAVAIAAPAVQHHELALACLGAGKHVFVEKPLALDVADAERVCDAAAVAGRQLMVGHLLRYHPAFLRLHELVRDGALGRIDYLYSNRLNLGRFRREENILWSFAPHDLSMILALVGAEPIDVSAVGSWPLHREVADVTTTHLSFPGGEQAHVFVSWLHPYKEQKLVVVGDRGMAVFDDREPWETKLSIYAHRVDWHDGLPQPVRAEAEPVPVKPGEPLEAECRHFLECVRNDETPRTDGREGLRVLRVLQAAERSLVATRDGARLDDAGRRAPKVEGVMIHESAYVDEPSEIGTGTRIWHFSHVLAGSRIGRDCTIGQNVVIGPNVVVGDRCRIQNNVSVYDGVTLEDGVFCGPSCVFTNVVNPRADVSRKDEFLKTRVGTGATIGANATIVCGHDIGEYAFVAAGAVVTADVVPFALVAGVPARRIGWMSHDGMRLGDDLTCPRSGRRYHEVSGRLEEIASG
jgi:predicted dehydrogenase/acetyltransferase-like isoleucine patch superfamily enzyme